MFIHDILGTEKYEAISYYNKNGRLHHDYKPAAREPKQKNGIYYIEMWYQHGKRHREDGPAFIHANGELIFYYDDKFIGRGVNGAKIFIAMHFNNMRLTNNFEDQFITITDKILEFFPKSYQGEIIKFVQRKLKQNREDMDSLFGTDQ